MFLKKRIIVVLTLCTVLLVLIASYNTWYFKTTIEIPIEGGTYAEGLVGQPKYLNPVFAVTDTDQDITSLVFSSLLKVDQKGEFVPDLAKSWEISDNGKQYDFFLKENIPWHDGELFTVDDVYFTIAVLQHPDTPSPLKANFANVAMEKVDPYHIRFRIPSPYAYFLHNLTIGILPYHVLKDLPPAQLITHDFNIKPIGTGPFKFKELVPDEKGSGFSSIRLVRNDSYFLQKPYIQDVVFSFFPATIDLINAYQRRVIDGIASLAPSDADDVSKTNIILHQYHIPEVQTVFFNLLSTSPVRDLDVRHALASAIDKVSLLHTSLADQGVLVDGPLLTPIEDPDLLAKQQGMTLASLQALLEEKGWKENPETGIREKNGEPLTFSLFLSSSTEDITTATTLVDQWQKIGVQVDLSIFSPRTLYQDYILTKNYDALLTKVNVGLDKDQYPLWHSSQRNVVGSFNFSNYSDIEVDRILQNARRILDPIKREESYTRFEEILAEDVPAIFLYSPYYLYGVDRKVQGIQEQRMLTKPSDRFNTIVQWSVVSKRVPKSS